MSEGSLVNRYRQYKAGTTKIVNWLAQTARKSKDITGILPSLKAANDAAKQAKAKKQGPSSDTNVKVTTAQLLSLSHVIVEAALPVPEEILHTIRTVIDERQHCAEWYSSMHGNAGSNDTHQHFIKVLKDILRLLERPKQSKSNAKAAKSLKPITASESEVNNGVVNIFELLQIDEPSADALDSASAPKKATKIAVTFELETSHHEKSFAIWCLLQDFREIRKEVKSMWLGYNDGKITYSTVSILTACAMDFMKEAEAEFVFHHPELQHYPSILDHVGLMIACGNDQVFISPYREDKPAPHSNVPVSKEEIASLFCPRAWLILFGFVGTLGRAIGKSKESAERMEGYLRTHPFGAVLTALLPRFEAVSRKAKDLRPSVDQFLTVLHLFAENPTHSPPTWAVIACQIHMDIYEIIGHNIQHEISHFEKQLSASAQRVQSLRQMFEETLLNPDSWHRQYKAFDDATKYMSELARDPYQRSITKPSGPSHAVGENAEQNFAVYKALPSIPGKIANKSASGLHNIAIAACDNGQVFLAAAYLYKAALKTGVISKPWLDMEFLIEAQSEKRPFVLEPDNGVESMAKCLGLSLGVKPQAFRRGLRPKLPDRRQIKEKCKHLDVKWRLVAAFESSGRQPINTAPDANFPVVKAGIESLERLQKTPNSSERLQSILQQYKRTRKVTSTQLLLGIKEALIADEMNLHFDYIGFFSFCHEILSKVNTECDPLELKTAGKPGEKIGVHCYEFVYAILWDAADHVSSSAQMEKSILFRAGALMEKLIGEEGDKHVNVAKDTIGKLMRPLLAQDDETTRAKKHQFDEDEELLRKFFGISTNEARGDGMFCSCKEELEARTNMLMLQHNSNRSSEDFADSDLFKAGCRVMKYSLLGEAEAFWLETRIKLYDAARRVIVGPDNYAEAQRLVDQCIIKALSDGLEGIRVEIRYGQEGASLGAQQRISGR